MTLRTKVAEALETASDAVAAFLDRLTWRIWRYRLSGEVEARAYTIVHEGGEKSRKALADAIGPAIAQAIATRRGLFVTDNQKRDLHLTVASSLGVTEFAMAAANAYPNISRLSYVKETGLGAPTPQATRKLRRP